MVPLPIHRAVERRVPTVTGVLVASPRDDRVNVPPSQAASHGRVAVPLVAHEALWPAPGPAADAPSDSPCVEQGVHVPRLVALTTRDDERHRLPTTLGAQVDLSGPWSRTRLGYGRVPRLPARPPCRRRADGREPRCRPHSVCSSPTRPRRPHRAEERPGCAPRPRQPSS